MSEYLSPIHRIAVANGHAQPIPSFGVGKELKVLLKKIGIEPTVHCSCNARARYMDAMGIEWCTENIDLIVGWLGEEAAKRGLPFIHTAGVFLVLTAIRRAKRSMPTAPTVPTPTV